MVPPTSFPVDNFGTVVGENPTPNGILALWAVNGLSIVNWVGSYLCEHVKKIYFHCFMASKEAHYNENKTNTSGL